jgi:predicted DNA-binding transcriptional regulator YafY
MARDVREKVWHPSQSLQARTDGSLVLTVRVTHLLEVKRWVLSYGDACEVLEPEELRQEVRAELQRTLRQYD